VEPKVEVAIASLKALRYVQILHCARQRFVLVGPPGLEPGTGGLWVL